MSGAHSQTPELGHALTVQLPERATSMHLFFHGNYVISINISSVTSSFGLFSIGKLQMICIADTPTLKGKCNDAII